MKVAFLADGMDRVNANLMRGARPVIRDYKDFSGEGTAAATAGGAAFADASAIAGQGTAVYSVAGFGAAAAPAAAAGLAAAAPAALVVLVVSVEEMGDEAGVGPDPADIGAIAVPVEYADPSLGTGRPAVGDSGSVEVLCSLLHKELDKLGRRFDEGDVSGRHPEIVLPCCSVEVHFHLVPQCARCIPFADSQEWRRCFGALLDPEKNPTTGDRIPMDVGRDGNAEAAIKFLGLQQTGKLLWVAGFGQGQYLARLPEDVGVGRGRGCDVRDSGAVPKFDGMEGAGHRVIGAPAVLLALPVGTAADEAARSEPTAQGPMRTRVPRRSGGNTPSIGNGGFMRSPG